MSLSCLECGVGGTFDTLILFAQDGKFDATVPISHYDNFFTCCASVKTFKAVKKSRFVVVREQHKSSMWNTPDKCALNDTEWKLVNENELKRKLPKIFEALSKNEEPKRWYYYQSERGCLSHPEAVDEIGVGIHDGLNSCSLSILLYRMSDRYTMKLAVHNDEWAAFVRCRDVLNLLATRVIKSGEMRNDKPFYALKKELEKLGYKNLGRLHTDLA